MRVKQVILVRQDLKMRRGKEIAQGSHASMDFLCEPLRLSLSGVDDQTEQVKEERTGADPEGNIRVTLVVSQTQRAWLLGGMAKVCLRVSTEEDLIARHQRARAAGLESHLILDSGRTEFGGVPTYTACAIGPDETSRIDAITGDLTLY